MYGCDECVDGYRWRGIAGGPNGDKICVREDALGRARQEEADHAGNVDPIDRTFGPNTCKQGFVHRAAFAADEICVTAAARSRVADENRRHRSPSNPGEAVTRPRKNPNCETADVRCN
jgi:hypothetical protein